MEAAPGTRVAPECSQVEAWHTAQQASFCCLNANSLIFKANIFRPHGQAHFPKVLPNANSQLCTITTRERLGDLMQPSLLPMAAPRELWVSSLGRACPTLGAMEKATALSVSTLKALSDKTFRKVLIDKDADRDVGPCCAGSPSGPFAWSLGFPSNIQAGNTAELALPGSYLCNQSLVLGHQLVQVLLVLADTPQEFGSLVLHLAELLICLRAEGVHHDRIQYGTQLC